MTNLVAVSATAEGQRNHLISNQDPHSFQLRDVCISPRAAASEDPADVNFITVSPQRTGP